MFKTLVFATLCVAALAQTDPPELTNVHSRAVRQAPDMVRVPAEMMERAAGIATEFMNTGAKMAMQAASMGKSAMPDPSSMNSRKRRSPEQKAPPSGGPPQQPPHFE